MIRSLLAVSVLALASSAHAVVLYDGSLGTSPTSQGLTYNEVALTAGPFYSPAAGGTTLNTTGSNFTSAGFGTDAVPLDRIAGYTLRVDAKVLAETHSGNPDRAGFSLLVLSSDHRGIELGFHTNEIFAQNDSPLFVRAETATFDTTLASRRYEIRVLGNSYTLTADGATVLTGPLRDYTAFVPPFNLADPYEVPNAIFLGDDTTSAQGSTTFSYVSVPEPTTIATIAGMAIVAIRRRR